MNRTARVILSKNPDRRQRLVYGVMASATTVFIEGSTVAVTVPRLSSAGALAADDHVALQKFGTDTLIIGRVGSGGPTALQTMFGNLSTSRWTIRTSAADNGWTSVAWAPELGLFAAVAVSGTGNRVMTSPDGITWTSRTSATDNNWQGVAWAPELGLFAAVANSGTGNRVMTSRRLAEA